MYMEEMEVDMENNNDEVSKKMNPATFGFGGFEATSTAGKTKRMPSVWEITYDFFITVQEGVRPGLGAGGF